MKMFSKSLKSLNGQQRHEYILKAFVLNKKHDDYRKHKRDIDVIREHHRFLWNDNDEETNASANESWEVRLARRYYDKLFKEYCIAELSRYKENKIALRWRTEAEVVEGVGQFQCGSRKCNIRDGLRTWEVNFAYQEQGDRKNALVKLRLCSDHSAQLNYRSKKREIKRLKNAENSKRCVEQIKSKSSKNEMNEASVKDKLLDGAAEMSSLDTGHEKTQDETAMDLTENVWNKKLNIEGEPISRETEFERYLEDLLL
uniref:Protein FRA10AC1 n=1 Tax=Glossina brevipalpis TaxID=37001 RepID=A0A1A9WFZ0_9MUSC